jgi:hypothetical protein
MELEDPLDWRARARGSRSLWARGALRIALGVLLCGAAGGCLTQRTPVRVHRASHVVCDLGLLRNPALALESEIELEFEGVKRDDGAISADLVRVLPDLSRWSVGASPECRRRRASTRCWERYRAAREQILADTSVPQADLARVLEDLRRSHFAGEGERARARALDAGDLLLRAQ